MTETPNRGVGKRKKDEDGVPFGDHRCTPREIWSVALEAIGIETLPFGPILESQKRDGFDFDAATNPHATIPARIRCTGPKKGGLDGLAEYWAGDTWLNFPFSEPNPWVAKVLEEARRMLRLEGLGVPAPRSITVLGPGDSSVTWWRALRSSCDAWAAWPRREHFPTPGQPKGSPPGPVHLWYFGPRSNYWRRIMESHGVPTEAGSVV